MKIQVILILRQWQLLSKNTKAPKQSLRFLISTNSKAYWSHSIRQSDSVLAYWRLLLPPSHHRSQGWSTHASPGAYFRRCGRRQKLPHFIKGRIKVTEIIIYQFLCYLCSLHNSLFEFFRSNNLLYYRQSGFMKKFNWNNCSHQHDRQNIMKLG